MILPFRRKQHRRAGSTAEGPGDLRTRIDRTITESVKATVEVIGKRKLRHQGYPPDLQKLATALAQSQAELSEGSTSTA